MSKVTVREAALLTGKSRETINSATKDGTLTYSLNGRKHKVIDISELERVYPLVRTVDEISKPSVSVKQRPTASSSDTQTEIAVLREKLAHSEVMQAATQSERERERRQLESEIETLRSSLAKAQEQHSKALLLITDQSGKANERGGDWQEIVEGLKAKIANHETNLEERLLEIREQAKQEAFGELKDKYWWQLVFKKRAG